MKLLENRVCLVTGAARGAGECIARTFSTHGATVLLCDVNETGGEQVAADLPNAEFVRLDVTLDNDWARVMEHCQRNYGGLDVLVNNAATLFLGAIEHTRSTDMRRLFEVNALGPFLGIQAAAPLMKAHGHGSIVNVGSVDSLQGLNGASAYCSSKWALRGLTKATALELGRYGIRVNLACPSSGNPEMFAPWADKLANAGSEITAYMENRCLPRGGELSELADAVTFLASDMSRYCSGTDLVVDGGLTAGEYIPTFSAL